MLITQIGSLPFRSVKKAVDYSLAHPIPFLPELPLLGDDMLSYIKSPGKLNCLEAFSENKFRTVKIQCIGPATLVMAGYTEDDAVYRICTHLDKIINKLTYTDLVVFLDEPSLGQAGFNYLDLWGAIITSLNIDRSKDITFGVHTCGNMNWDALFNSPLEIISFDASKYPITAYSGYKTYRNNGGAIAWGVDKLEDVVDRYNGDFLTSPCGLGPFRYKESDCYKVYNSLYEINEGA